MRAPRLSLLLILLVTAIVIAVTGAVTLSATRTLRKVAEEEALSATALAAASVVEDVRRERETLASTARLLAERPTLARLVLASDVPGLTRFLETFRATSGLETCAITRGLSTLARVGEGSIAPSATDAPSTLAVGETGLDARLAARADVPSIPGAAVVVGRRIEPGAGNGVARRGLSVRFWGRGTLAREGFGPRSPLREVALDGGVSKAARVREDDVFVAVAPLTVAGETAGIVEATIPLSEVSATTTRWVRDVRRIALVALVLALAGCLVLGRAIAGPIEDLTRAAERIGRGDLDTPVRATSGGETGTLARTMETMRLRLIDLAAESRRQQAETEAILAGLTAGVYAVDEDRRIVYLSARGAAMLGTTEDLARGRFCGDVLRPREAGRGRPCEDRCPIVQARVGSTARAVENLEPDAAGALTVVVTSSPPTGGRQIQLLRHETEAETTQRLRDAVVANISHEFKTPLAAQLASIEILRDQLGDLTAEQAGDLVLALERGARRLTRLIDNLLESVRLDAGATAIRKRPLALDEVLEEAVESMRPLVEQRGQRLDVELPHPLPDIEGDGPRLTQVFVNLIANANKFAPPETTIRVGGTVVEGGVTLWVEDEGPGLQDAGDTLFERFARTPGEEPEQSGMGLGLWIAKSIVDRHGGRIWSEPVPEGAKLCVHLPGARHEDPGDR